MRHIPFDLGTIHFAGIGGIGMSGIAEVMHNLGYEVQGSDISENANVERLRKLGIKVLIGQRKENLEGVSVVVTSTAVKADNAEVVAANEMVIPVVRRADMLAELMRLKWCVSVAGTHGKTTTTSMVASVLDAGEFDPTVINGGIINAYGTNARVGDGGWMVVEADESDGSFLKLPATLAVVTNIDPEHMDFYGDFDAVKAAFRTFVEKVPFYGAAILCIDHPEVQAMIPHISNRRVVTYGVAPQADVRAINIDYKDGGANFDIELSDHAKKGARVLKGFHLPMPGKHNVQNATAAIAVGLEMEMPDEKLSKAFDGFKGVKRRFTNVGSSDGVTVIDDYGHHPVEIEAVLKAARQAYKGRIVAVVQPHRFTRVESLFEEFCTAFNDADEVVVAPIYPAGEQPLEGISHETLAQGMRAHGHRNVHTLDSEENLAALVKSLTDDGDLVVCLGAGTITNWANDLPAQLDKIKY
jgi:UDP-N-acetylmuramate--alanine ligase